ncbi:MAG TPA: 2OG-Fe(II) oxygenase [Rhizomicrobium sp.]|nr:2OG-Fe(II) oxygenase [Rhizomicrobium sp.]
MSSARKPASRTYVNLAPGDPAPNFVQRLGSNEGYAFNRAAGRYVALCFIASAGDRQGAAAMDAAYARRDLFDDVRASFFAVTLDRRDDNEARLRPDQACFRDLDGSVSRLYGCLPHDFKTEEASVPARRFWLVLDPMLRVLRSFPFAEGKEIPEVFAFLDSLPPPERHAGIELQAPILFLPNVFDPDLCRRLIGLYEAHGGNESGFMREVGGKTVVINDPVHKRRRDHILTDQTIIDETKACILRRIVPEIAKAHQFHVTRMERFIVACYSADEEGHFNAHRDNTTKGTAHRRFAVSLNLNDDYEGGELSFPEFGPRRFKPPAGAAVVFSCSLLHQASLVTRGKRYVFLPFLYDEAAAKIREANNKFLDDAVGPYKA